MLSCARRTRLLLPAYSKMSFCTPVLIGPPSPCCDMMGLGAGGPGGRPPAEFAVRNATRRLSEGEKLAARQVIEGVKCRVVGGGRAVGPVDLLENETDLRNASVAVRVGVERGEARVDAASPRPAGADSAAAAGSCSGPSPPSSVVPPMVPISLVRRSWGPSGPWVPIAAAARRLFTSDALEGRGKRTETSFMCAAIGPEASAAGVDGGAAVFSASLPQARIPSAARRRKQKMSTLMAAGAKQHSYRARGAPFIEN